MKARIFDIKRFAVHDGEGIRTTVFFKGCPLKCVWCHNPEGIDFEPQLARFKNKCTACGECSAVCPRNAHTAESGVHKFSREKCIACGKCERACPNGALLLYGKETAAEELIPLLLKDKDFYNASGGGVTLSGGECLSQPDFCGEVLKRLKTHGINTAVDTCGFVPRASIDKVMEYTDVFLYDIKAIDEAVHIKCTGRSNRLILENLKYIDECGKKTEIRVPYVPNLNSDQLEKIGEFVRGLKNITKVKLLPYHNYAGSKYLSLDMENTLPEALPSPREIAAAGKILRKYGAEII